MEPFLGQIELFPFGFAPEYWMYCDGSLLQISTNPPLYSLLGTAFGGDGTTNFGIPDLRNAAPNPNMHYCIALAGIYPPRN